jgi:hypothetical protein
MKRAGGDVKGGMRGWGVAEVGDFVCDRSSTNQSQVPSDYIWQDSRIQTLLDLLPFALARD